MSPPDSRSLDSVAAEFLRWAADDYVELLLLRQVIRRHIGSLSPEVEREVGLDVLRELFSGGLLRVGEMRADAPGLVYWDGPPSDLVERVKSLWNVHAPPAMGEPPWFYASDAGKSVVGGAG